MNAAGPDARFAHDAGKTGKNLASRQERTQKQQIAGHDAGKTGKNLASRQEKGTGEREGNRRQEKGTGGRKSTQADREGNRGKREGNADRHQYIRTYADQGQTVMPFVPGLGINLRGRIRVPNRELMHRGWLHLTP